MKGRGGSLIQIELQDWDEKEIKQMVTQKIVEKIISNEFELYGNIPKEGCYTPYDKFKNYIANLVADRIFGYMVNNEEIENRITKSIEKAEKAIVAKYMKDYIENNI